MNRKRALLACVLVLLFAVNAYAQELTREFPQHHCKFSLPDETWSWTWGQTGSGLDSPCMASNEKGDVITLMVLDFPRNAHIDEAFIEQFEKLVLADVSLVKTGSKQLTWRGLPAYQIRWRDKGNEVRGVITMFLAHGFCYQLQVGSESGDGPSDELVQAAMDGFAFTKAPPALPSEPAVPTESATRKAYRFSYWMGRVAAICFILILVALVLNKTVFRKKREEDTSERDKAA